MEVATQEVTQTLEQAASQAIGFVDGLSLTISIISIVISISVAIYEVRSNKKLNDISLEFSKKLSDISIESSYFNEIYQDYLLKDLPKHRKVITFNYQGKLVGTQDLLKGLKEIRENSLYYYYTDRTFYNELKQCVQDLEDFITHTENRTITAVDQAEVQNEIEAKIKKIYIVMTEKCFNG